MPTKAPSARRSAPRPTNIVRETSLMIVQQMRDFAELQLDQSGADALRQFALQLERTAWSLAKFL